MPYNSSLPRKLYEASYHVGSMDSIAIACLLQDASKAVSDLQSKIASLGKMVPVWISTDDHMPELEQESVTGKWSRKVLFWIKKGHLAVGYYNFTHSYWMTEDECFEYEVEDVTHWMELPPPPIEVEPLKGDIDEV